MNLSKNLQLLKLVFVRWFQRNKFKGTALLLALAYQIKKALKRPEDLTGKVVLITGAASGIGANMAKRFARLGCTLVLWDIVKEKADARVNRAGKLRYLEKVKEIITKETQESCEVLTYKIDLTDKKKIEEVSNQTKKDLNGRKVDILINNAGIVSGDYITDLKDKKIELTFAVNVLSHFYILKQFLPPMLEKNDGHVVTIASAAGTCGLARMTDYCASKYAAVGLAESLRLELSNLGKTGVKTTLVCPYYIDTGMFKGVKVHPLMPILGEDYTCKSIVKAVRVGQPVLKLPLLTYFNPFLDFFLPVTVRDRVMTFLSINNSMDDFH